MFWIPLYKLLGWKDWLKLAGVVLAVVALFAMVFSWRGSTTDTAIEMDSARIEKELAEAKARSEAIDAELFDLREELQEVRNEIEESVRERDEMHEALDDAVTIDDVNQLLRKRRRRGN